MAQLTRATLVFPRTGQVVKVAVPAEQYGAVTRRNNELIRYFSSRVPAAKSAPDASLEQEKIDKMTALAA